MSKSNTKTKLTLLQGTKKKKNASTPVPKEVNETKSTTSPLSLEQLATVEFWKQEIAELKSESFNSVEQATEKLIGQVLERLKLKEQGEDDVKEFLRLVFESSEVLQSSLKKTLKLD